MSEGVTHLVPFFLRKVFLLFSVRLLSSSEVKPPLSSVTDSSTVDTCFPGEGHRDQESEEVGIHRAETGAAL